MCFHKKYCLGDATASAFEPVPFLQRRLLPPQEANGMFVSRATNWMLRAVIVAFMAAGTAWSASEESGKEMIAAKNGMSKDKSGYTLFNPAPAELMRELSTDRPDKTESPYTVDAGHFQVEMDLANLTLDRADGVRTRTWNLASANFKVGLLNNVDLEVVFDGYVRESVEDRGAETTTRTSGVGDLTVRLKTNFWGNDGGPTAFGMMPFLKIPTNSHGLGNNAVEGGVIFPLAVSLPGGWDVGLMTEFDFLRNEENASYHVEFINSITFSHDIVGKLGGYVEFFTNISTESGARWVATVDLGLTYGLTDNIQLDAGCNIGVTRSADDLQPFIGISVRF